MSTICWDIIGPFYRVGFTKSFVYFKIWTPTNRVVVFSIIPIIISINFIYRRELEFIAEHHRIPHCVPLHSKSTLTQISLVNSSGA